MWNTSLIARNPLDSKCSYRFFSKGGCRPTKKKELRNIITIESYSECFALLCFKLALLLSSGQKIL